MFNFSFFFSVPALSLSPMSFGRMVVMIRKQGGARIQQLVRDLIHDVTDFKTTASATERPFKF